MLCLDDCFATTTMPQPTKITQFIFGQPLNKGPALDEGQGDFSAGDHTRWLGRFDAALGCLRGLRAWCGPEIPAGSLPFRRMST
jgi:hypothetical protein